MSHGFLLRHGKFSTIYHPGEQATTVEESNRSRTIGGVEFDVSGAAYLMLLKDGVYHDFDDPHAGSAYGQGTGFNTIDDGGNIGDSTSIATMHSTAT